MGVFVAPSSISASNQSRSDARTAYFDTVLERSNLHIASGQMVTQILLAADGVTSNASAGQLQRAVGVEVSRAQPSLFQNQVWQNYITYLPSVHYLGLKCQNQC